MSSTPQFNGEQLAAARKERWHQGGDALLTLEAAREWVGELGFVLFAPRAHQLPAPGASLVEATLGREASAPTAAEMETARGLVGRIVAEGAVLPLNLLGGPGDVPDFVVSAQMFSYVFTLRGDKAWKQAPATSGSLKVSLLAAKVYEALAQGNAMTAPELASELGREVTETAIVRALVELWAQLRVIPLLQQDQSATMWELTSRRFTKQMKAGANAGQPTALSALISAYLAQVYAATEEEVETFLSPLAARSRVRDVLHGLSAGRQLENVVLEGKTMLYIPGALPEFPEIAAPEQVLEEVAATADGSVPATGERIRKFDRPREAREPRKPREDRGERPFRGDRERPAKPFRTERPARPFRSDRDRPAKPFAARERSAKPFGAERSAKPFRADRPAKPFGANRERPAKPFAARERSAKPFDAARSAKPFGEKRPGERREGKSFGERERRPFQRDGAKGERSSFTRPWDAERKPSDRRERSERPQGERPVRERPPREGDARPSGEKREFRVGARKTYPQRGPRQERTFRPRREEGEGSAPRAPKTFRLREEGGREGGERRTFRRAEGDARPRPRADGKPGGRPAGKPGFGGKGKFDDKRKFAAKSSTDERPKFSGKPKFGDKPKFGSKPKFGDKARFGDKPKFGDKAKFAGKPKFGDKAKFGSKPKFGDGPKSGERKSFGGKAPSGDKKKFAGKPKFGGKPGAKGGPRKDSGKPRREAEE